MIVSGWILLRRRNILDIKLQENETRFLCYTAVFWILRHLWDNVENYGRAWQYVDDNKM
jgi:hypothetical protein